jgi:hypothetical protein
MHLRRKSFPDLPFLDPDMMKSHSFEASTASKLQVHLATTGFQRISIDGSPSLLFFWVAHSIELRGRRTR